MGRRKRLKSRFTAHDKEINGWLAVFTISFLAFISLLIWILDRVAVPGRIANWSTVGIGFATFFGFLLWYRRLAYRIGKKHNLLCANCRKPLRKHSFLATTGDRDHRADGEVPDRCPRCKTNIVEAISKNEANQTVHRSIRRCVLTLETLLADAR
jgi:phage FluMu protein Com